MKSLISRLRDLDVDAKELARGSASAFGVKILAAGAAFALNVVVARLLGADQAGLFFLSFTIVLVVASISRLGLDNTFVRFIASYRTEGDWPRINGLYWAGLRWALAASLLAAALLFVSAVPLAVTVFAKPGFAEVMQIMACAVPLVALFTLHARALQGLKRVSESMAVLSVITPLVAVLLALMVWPSHAAAFGWLYVAAAAVTLGLGVWSWRRHAALEVAAEAVERRAILASCLPLLMVVALSQAVSWSSQILLGVWASSADIAIFNAAQRTAMLTSFVLVAVNSIAAPKFAAMYRMQQHDALRRTTHQATRMMVVLALFPLGLMLLFPGEILWLFGPEFSDGAGSLQILAIGQFINVATGSVGYLLMMTGHERLLRNNVAVAAVITVTLGFALIPIYGIIGGAIATASGVALQNLLCVWQVKRVLGFHPFGGSR